MLKTTYQTEALLDNDYIYYVGTTVNDNIKVITFEMDRDVDVKVFTEDHLCLGNNKVVGYDEVWIDDEFKEFRINYIDKFSIKDEDEFIKRIKVYREYKGD